MRIAALHGRALPGSAALASAALASGLGLAGRGALLAGADMGAGRPRCLAQHNPQRRRRRRTALHGARVCRAAALLG